MKFNITIIALLAANMFAAVAPAFAEDGALIYYGKGVADESSPLQGETIRTIINNDKATIVHPGQTGIQIVRLDIEPSDQCIQSGSTFCFVGTVTETKNTDAHDIGDEVEITLDLEGKTQVMSVNSGAMQGTIITINLSKTIIKSDEPFLVSITREGGFAGLPGRTTAFDSSNGEISIGDAASYFFDALDQDTVDKITKQVKRANLLNIAESNYPPHPSSADYFTYTLEFTQGAFKRTITWTDTSDDVPEKLNVLRDAITQASENLGKTEQNSDIADIALDFVRSSPTFAFDGMEDTLSVGQAIVMESFPEQYRLEASFTSTHGGFGDRTGQMVTQALTPHVMDILISEGEVLSAVTDGQWDELNHQYVLKEP